MYSKNNKKMNDQKQLEKVNQYGIKKFNVGTASVLVAAGFAFLGGGNALASNDTAVNNADKPTSETATVTTPAKDETPAPTVAKANKTNLSAAIARVQNAIAKAAVTEKTTSAIEEGKAELANAQALEASETATQGEVDKATVALKNRAFVLESMPKATADKKEEKVNKNQDPRNGQAIPGQGESGFRAATESTVGTNLKNPIIPATEGPTNNNKLGSGNNPANGVFESAQDQFGDIDFTNATEKSGKVEKQWSRTDTNDKVEPNKPKVPPVELGSITYNWKEKEITADEANNNNALNGWKITAGDKVTAIKPEAPTEVDPNRPEKDPVSGDSFKPKPSKIYNLEGKIPANYNDVKAENQNYSNGVKYSGVVGTHDFPKGYYLELGKQGTKISKEFDVNGNSRVMLSAITGGGYGNMGTGSHGERVKITVYDVASGKKIASIRDDQGIGTKFEEEHINSPATSGANGDGWNEYRAIYEIPEKVNKVRVEIEALDDGQAINNNFLKGTNSKITDGYFVGAVNLAVGTGVEMTTNVKSNKVEGKYGEDNLYKAKQTGELEFTVNSVGGVRHYGHAETEIEVPKGVEIPDNIKNPTGWVWFGDTPVAAQNISWDENTRTLKIKYQTSKSNNGDVPYIGIGSNDGKNDGVRKFRLPFTTSDNYKGTATFKVKTSLPNGLRDGEDNELLNTGDVSNANGKYRPVVNGVRNTDQPDYYYNKTIYIDTIKPVAPTVEAIHTDSINGEKTDNNQPTELLISVPTEKNPNLSDENREKADVVENDKNNGTNRNADTEVDNIKKAIGGLTTMKVTLPNSSTPITLTKKEDGWYNGTTKIEERAGKLVLPVPAGTDLTEANVTTNPDKRIKVTVLDKAGNESDPAYGDVVNQAPTVAVMKKDIYVYKTKEDNKLTSAQVLKKAEVTATDLEDDRDGVDSTKPTIAVSNDGGLDSTKPGDYTVRVQSTDSEGKKSDIDTTTVHVLDLITVDPTVTTDPANPSTTAPVSPKTADTPVKPGDENYGKYPAGITRDDLVKEVTRTIKYIDEAEKDNPNAPAIDEDAPERVQKVTYKRTATVNPETGEVTYSDWSVYEGTGNLSDASVDGTKGKFNSADSPVIEGYLQVEPADKTIPEKEAPAPSEKGDVNNEVVKVLYKKVGSFKATYPEGKRPNNAAEEIKYPNNPEDPTKLGDFSRITIPHVEGFIPTYNGTQLTPVDPTNLSKGYKVPDDFIPTDKFGDTPITYIAGEQKATVKFVSVDAQGNETPLPDKYNITDLKGKTGEKISENQIQARIDVLKSMGYTVKENPFDQNPTFDTIADTDTEISQNFVVKLTPKVSTPGTIYVVDGNKPEIDKVKNAVTTEGNEKTVDESKLPDTTGKAGQEVKVPVEVTYGTGDNTRKETVDVTAKVVKGNPQIIPVDQGQPLAENSINKGDYPEGATFEYEKVDGKDPVNILEAGDYPVNVIVKDKDGNTLVKVPTTVRVVDAYRQYVPVNTDPKKVLPSENIAPTDFPDGTTFEYKTPVDTSAPGDKDVIVVAKLNNEPIAEIPAKVTVVGPKTQYVVANPDNTQPTAADSLVDKDKYSFPDNAKFEYKEKVDTTTPGEKDATVVVKDADDDTIVEVPAKVKVVQGYPQIIPVAQGQPLPENSVNTKEYPEGATFEYEKVDGKDPVNISEAGDYPVTVVVKDKDGNTLVKVPTTVRVVDAYRQYVPVNTDPTKVLPSENIVPTDFPDGTTFEYKTPVDTSTPGDKDVVVVAKLKNGETIAEIPAKVTVVEPKTQYVAVGNEPDVNKSVDPSVFPKEAEAKPEYKEKDISKTPGIKDVTVVVKDKDGDSIVEVPAKVVVAEGKEQLVPASEENKQPDAKDSVDPKLFPEGTTFKYKTPVNTTTSGSKNVTVVVIDKNGNTLVEVPAVVKVAKPGSIETPITNDKFTPEDIAKYVEIPEGAKVTKVEGDNNLDLTTPGKKDPVKVTVELPNGKTITVDVPVTVTPVKEIETPVTKTPLTPEDYTKGIKIPKGGKVTNVENIPDLTTPGKKAPVKVTVELPNGKTITVEVPVTVTPVKEILKKLGDPITNEEVEKHVDIPEGGKIISIGDKPTTDVPGERPSIPVVIELPGGQRVTINVPVIVTPKTTPIIVEVGTPITKEDVIGHIDLPKGWKVKEIGTIPTTDTAGDKDSVKVVLELPDGRTVTVEVPVTVTPKHVEPSTPAGPTTPEQPQGENGNKPQPETPAKPEKPSENTKPEAPKAPVAKAGEKVLPNTGIADNNSALAGLGLAILGLAAAARRRKQK